MGWVTELVRAGEPAPTVSAEDAARAAQELGEWVEAQVVEASLLVREGTLYALGRRGGEKVVVVAGKAAGAFRGRSLRIDEGIETTVGPTDAGNAEALRERLPMFVPGTVGVRPASFGCGDRLGLATPGHVRAVRGTGLVPIFAQQSIREMERTGRTPQQVQDDAMWGAFQAGWHEGFGSDADHLKTPEDIDATAAAGFTLYTIDPGDHVDDAADTDSPETLAEKYEQIDWAALETTAADCRRTYAGAAFPGAEGARHTLDEAALVRAAVKYGGAVAHTVRMYRHLVAVRGDRPTELEVSVDETATPTTPAEHFYVASELRRLGVAWISLAPRFVGKFEKGVDYQGDVAELERTLVEHVALCRELGPYKISLHSGSDKFTVYPIARRLAGALVHVKTAGTSYLEALRALAGTEPGLFREILDFARQRYEEDRATYHVSADLGKVPAAEALTDGQLPALLEDFHARQVLHVTYGSVLQEKSDEGTLRFADRLLAALREHEEAYEGVLETHFRRHMTPLAEM